MDAIWQGLSGIFEVALIAGLGFFLAKKGWFWENAAKDLTRLTMTVALPPLMIHSLYANFTHDALLAAAPDLVLPFVSIFASYLAGHVLASLLHISKGRRGIFICTCCIANAIFIGVPVNVALFGEASVPSCMLYYLANTTMFWALGAYLIIRDAGGEHRFTLKEMLLKLRTPPLMGFAAGVILLLANVPIPHFAMAAMKYVGGMATPMALMVIGIQMSRIPFSSIHFDKDLVGGDGRPFPSGTALPLPASPRHSYFRDVIQGLSHAGGDAGDDEYDNSRDRSRGGCGVLDDGQLRLACPRCILCAVLYVYALVRRAAPIRN